MILRKLLMLVFLAVAMCVMSAGVGAAAVITVDDSGGADFTSIHAAVDAAVDGDTIEVRSGTYVENVYVNKQLTLRGIDTGAGMPVVDAGGSGGAIKLRAEGITLEGFTATNSEQYGGITVLSNNNTIINNSAIDNYLFGIDLRSSNNNITGNNVSNNIVNGIFLIGSNNTIKGNIINNNNMGIKIRTSSNIPTSNHNTIIGNILNNNYEGIYVFYSSNNNNIIDNFASNNIGRGILIATNNNYITGNTVSNNKHGIALMHSSSNILTNNNANSNIWGGITLSDSNSNILTNNNANSNIWGITLSDSSSNILYHNNLNNTNRNAYDTGTNNQWDSGAEGNYYGDDYTGTDSNNDDIGDTPYPIPGGSSVDNYPLMAPYSPTPPPSEIQDKSLLQVEGQPEVYWLQNDRLYWVTDWNVINNMSGVPGWDNVNILPASEFDPVDYEQGPRFITTGAESDGLLIREQGHPEVYLIQGGEMHHFTSPEALLWNGYSFDDVINVSTVIIGMFSSGSDISITQAIIDKYYEQGGKATFGAQAGTGEQPGDPDNAGVICTYVNFQNGAIEYFTNGDQAGNAYAILNPFFDKWASMGYAKSVLGYPISDMSDTQTSSLGTPFKYQNFMNGTERGALEYNLTSGEVFEIHGAIYATWSAMGYANSILGLVTSDEREAVPSFKGTTGRVSDFENGHLHWHSSGDHYMATYMTYGDLDEFYFSMGGTASWLGFPVMHQEERSGYGYCEFEGGYIEWDGSEYKAILYVIEPKVSIPIYSPIQQFAHQGTILSYLLTIKNDGNMADIIDISCTQKYSWDVILETNSVSLKPGESKDIYLGVIVGEIGNEIITVTAKSRLDTSKYSNAKFYAFSTKDLYAVNQNFKNENDEKHNLIFNAPSYVNINNKIIELNPGEVHTVQIDFSLFNEPDDLLNAYVEVLDENTDIKIKLPIIFRYGEHPTKIISTGFNRASDAYSFSNNNPIWGEGACYGMSATSILYFTRKLSLPSNAETTYFLGIEDAKKNIDDYQTSYKKNRIPATFALFADNKMEEGEYNKLKENIGNGEPLVFFLSDGHVGGEAHAVVAYKVVEDNEDISYILIYNPNCQWGVPKVFNYLYEPNYITYDRHSKELHFLTWPKFYWSTVSPFFTWAKLKSPGELRIYNDYNQVTGFVNGQVMEEIPNSAYNKENEAAIIFSPIDSYYYEIIGTDEGTYGLEISLIKDGKLITFNAFDIPTDLEQNHQYYIDWEMLSNNQNGVYIKVDLEGDGIFDRTIVAGNTLYIYNVTFLPPITTMEQFNLTNESTLPIKFTVNHHITSEFIYDDTVNVTITNSTGHLITYFTNGTGTGSVRINSTEEQYVANFQTKDYAINIGETYSVTVTFGEPDSLRGYDITYFTLIEGGKAKGKGN